MNAKNIFTELKRRNVYRAAVAYGVVAWFLMQLTTQVFPFFEIPNSAVRFVVIALVVGFPIAMLLAWLYELTPEGIVRTEDLDPVQARSVQRASGRILDFIIIGVLLLVIAMMIVGRRPFSRQTGESISQKSIAVLPFENLSKDEENAYFAGGVQDEILTNLGRIADLKVISRTSVMKYKSGPERDLREIGRQLGVAHVMEGTVQRVGNRVRVNAQLVDARTDRQLWGQTYDRDLADVFAIQTDLAQKIANELRAKLSPSEKARMERKPTENSEAYLAFMQGNEIYHRPDKFPSNTEKAAQLFEKATKLDPNFAAAFAGLSLVENWIYHSFDPTPGRREKARRNADEALRLQPDLPEGHLALGFSYYYGDRNYERALAEFEIAELGLPNESEAYFAIGGIQRRQGKWAESNANLEKAATLDPKNTDVLINLCFSYMAQRDFETASKILDRVIAASPQSFQANILKGFLAAQWKGDLSAAEKVFSSIPPETDSDGLMTMVRVWLLMLQRKLPEALQVAQQFRGDTLFNTTTAPCPKAFLEGEIYRLQGDEAKARTAFEHARVVSEQLLREAPDDPARHGQHGLILAALGQKQEAIAEGKRAVELVPESQDAFDGPLGTAALAQIYAWTGEFDEAFRLLDHLLTVPTPGLTVPMLKLDPAWDPLRKDPRYQGLIDKYAPKT